MSKLAERIDQLSPERKALLELLIRQKGIASSEVGTIPRAPESNSYVLSFAQQRLWFLDQMEQGNAFYNEPLLAIRITGPLNRVALSRTVDEICARHESLRTTFANVEGRPIQVIAPPRPVPVPFVDLRCLPAPQREAELKRLAFEEARRPFGLAEGPLLRVSLIQMDDMDHVIFWEMHHIITDGWSNRILLRELALLYDAFSANKPNPLPMPPIRYVDFAVWQRRWLEGKTLDSLVAYWKQQLGGHLPTLNLPTDYPRPTVQRYRGRLKTLIIPREISDPLKRLSQREDCTLFMSLLAAFFALLYRYTGQEHVVVGSPIANRSRKETEGVIGFFVNTLVLRGDLSGNPTFTELMARVRKVAVDAYTHQDLPFEKLVEVLQPERDLSRQALFQVLFVLHNYPKGAGDVQGLDQGLTLTRMEVDGGESKMDLAMAMTDLEGGGLKAQINYNTDLFSAPTMTGMLKRYEALLRNVVARPETRLKALAMSRDDEAGRDVLKKREREEAFLGRLRGARRKPVTMSLEGETEDAKREAVP